MKCTNCKKGELTPSYIDKQFKAHTCSNCEGNWILIEDYASWKELNPEHSYSNDDSTKFETEETKKALLCPVSGTIMRKFKISNTTEHRLDYSVATGGVWLDKGEWELLKQEGLAGFLNSVLTAPWQKNIRLNNTIDNFSEIYKNKFGQDSYEKLKEFRKWLIKQDNKSDLKAYILAEDPYSAEK
jgi:Zn-finger nucleic acid-binding protein